MGMGSRVNTGNTTGSRRVASLRGVIGPGYRTRRRRPASRPFRSASWSIPSRGTATTIGARREKVNRLAGT